jgi:hypothetical protein
MLNFLRKIRKSLIESLPAGKSDEVSTKSETLAKEEGSTRKPASPAGRYMLYAIGEIALVVIGILIALQINNWNEAQKSLKKEITVYQEIYSELGETLNDVLKDKEDWEYNFNATVKIRDMLVQNKFQEDTLVRYLFRTFDLEQSNPKTSAFESLKSLGLDMLSNDTLRQSITTLYQLTIPLLVKSDAAIEAAKIREKIYPLWEPYLKVNRFEIQKLLDLNEPSYNRGKYLDIKNVESLVMDELLLLTLQNSLNWRLKVIRQHEWVVKRIESVMSDIEAEIERLS